MSDNYARATHKGILHIADAELQCFVLDDGTRVISGRGLTRAIGMKGRAQGVARILTHSTLSPFIDAELRHAVENPIQFVGFSPKPGEPSSGYEATILLNVCEAILRARDADVLRTEQELRYARACDALVRSFAKVGIIALVDEATGYQADRDRSELQKILSAYISAELLPWTKRFPDDFYEQMFRLRGWQYRPISVKRPRLVGRLTSQLVYEKLPPGVLDELRRKNPANEKGQRKHKHHQFLTEDIGNPHLEKHLAQVTMLMRISPNWPAFERFFARAFPGPATQTSFLDDEEE